MEGIRINYWPGKGGRFASGSSEFQRVLEFKNCFGFYYFVKERHSSQQVNYLILKTIHPVIRKTCFKVYILLLQLLKA